MVGCITFAGQYQEFKPVFSASSTEIATVAIIYTKKKPFICFTTLFYKMYLVKPDLNFESEVIQVLDITMSFLFSLLV